MELEVPGQLGVKMELKDTGRTNEIERLMNLWKNKTAECKQVISSIHTQISYISSLRVGGGVGETESVPDLSLLTETCSGLTGSAPSATRR